MSEEEEKKKTRIAECSKTISEEILTFLQNSGNSSYNEDDIKELAIVLAEQGNRCLAHVSNQSDSATLKQAIDSRNSGAVASLLRLIFDDNKSKGRGPSKQDCKELLKKIPHLAIMADMEFPQLMPDPEALDILCKTGKSTNTQNPLHPLPMVNLTEPPWFPYTDRLASQLRGHFDHLRNTKKLDEPEFFLRFNQWVHVTLRHIITAEASGLLKPYGGILPQLERMARLTLISMQTTEEHVYALDVEERLALAKKAERRDSLSQITEYIISGSDKTSKEVETIMENRKNKRNKLANANKRQRSNTRGSNDGGGARRDRNPIKRGTIYFYYEPECRTPPLSPRMSVGKVVSFDPFIRVLPYHRILE